MNKIEKKIKSIYKKGKAFNEANLKKRNILGKILKERKPLIIIPAGRIAKKALSFIKSLRLQSVNICDNDKKKIGEKISGFKIKSIKDLSKTHKKTHVLIASAMHDSELYDQAKQHGLRPISFARLSHEYPQIFSTKEFRNITTIPFRRTTQNKIIKLRKILSDKVSQKVLLKKILFYLTLNKALLKEIRSKKDIYFESFTKKALGKNTVFCDAGAFNGDTFKLYIKNSNSKLGKYFAFEPDPNNFRSLKQTVKDYKDKVVIENMGLFNKPKTIKFSISGHADTRIHNEGQNISEETTEVRVTSLDKYFKKIKPSFIKMDIEGAERWAIQGGLRVIKRSRPILAISCYHSPQDLWEIPIMLKRMIPRSRIFLRHYSNEIDDTVCYLIPK